MQCKCGEEMQERQEDLKKYLRCPACTRSYSPPWLNKTLDDFDETMNRVVERNPND